MVTNTFWFNDLQGYIRSDKIEDRKCDMFGCLSSGCVAHQIAPGTQVWLCEQCLKVILKEEGRDADQK